MYIIQCTLLRRQSLTYRFWAERPGDHKCLIRNCKLSHTKKKYIKITGKYIFFNIDFFYLLLILLAAVQYKIK